MESKFQPVESKSKSIESKLNSIERKLKSIESKLKSIEYVEINWSNIIQTPVPEKNHIK